MSSSNSKRPAAVPIRPGIKITQPSMNTNKSSSTSSSSLPPSKSTTTTINSSSSSSSSSSSATVTKINGPTLSSSNRTSAQSINVPSSRTNTNNQTSSSSSFSQRSSSENPTSSLYSKNSRQQRYSTYEEEDDDDNDNEYDLPTASSTSQQQSQLKSLSTKRNQKYSQNIQENAEEEDEDMEPSSSSSSRHRRRTESVSAGTTTTTTVSSKKGNLTSTAVIPVGSSSSSLSSTIVRPVAVTKYGIRQFVESQHGLRLYLQNCVASCDLQCLPDLPHIATHARNAEYNPQRFAAVILRLREPRSTALIFGSGKVVLTGARNEEDSLLGIRKICKIIQVLGFPATVSAFSIQNMVATGDCGFPIRLEGMADEHSKFSSYEPELFPGLIYRMVTPKIVFLVFVSGKIVITGAKTRTDVVQGINLLYPVLFKYRKAIGSNM